MKESYRKLYEKCKKEDVIFRKEKLEKNGLTFWVIHFFSENREQFNTVFYIVNDLIVAVAFEWCENVYIFEDEY